MIGRCRRRRALVPRARRVRVIQLVGDGYESTLEIARESGLTITEAHNLIARDLVPAGIVCRRLNGAWVRCGHHTW